MWVLVGAGAAWAAPDDVQDLGQTPGALAWIDLFDSSGISVWNHEFSVDRGGVTAVDKFLWSGIAEGFWGGYRVICILGIWFLDWALSMQWLQIVAAPLLAVGDAMRGVVNGIGVVPTLLTLTAMIAVVWMARGKWSTGIWELALACVIASLASGVLADPVRMVAGPDGYITQSALAGQEIASELATGDAAGKTPQQLRDEQTGQLVDTFIRQPTQMINYGAVLDGGPCEGPYNEVVADGPYGPESDIRDKVNDCESVYGDYAANPSVSMAVSAFVFAPAAFIILAMAVVLAGSVLAAGCTVLYQGVKAIIALVIGLLPGGGRQSLMLTVAEVLMNLLILLITSIFLSVFLLVVQALFESGSGDSIAQTFVVVDVVLLVGIIIFWRQRANIKKASERLATWMSQRPGGGSATRMPKRSGGELGAVAGTTMGAVRTASGLSQARQMRAAAKRPAGASYVDARTQNAFFGSGQGGSDQGPLQMPHQDLRPPASGSTQRALSPGSGARPMPGPGPGGGSGGAMRRIQGRAGKAATGVLVRAGTHAVLAASTGGASTVLTATSTATRAVKAIDTTRRAALTARLATSAATSTGAPTAKVGSAGPGPARPMPPRTQPAPPLGPTSAARGPGSGDVVTGQVLSSRPSTPPVAGKRDPGSRQGPASSSASPVARAEQASSPGAVLARPTSPAASEPGSRPANRKPAHTASKARSTAAATPTPPQEKPAPAPAGQPDKPPADADTLRLRRLQGRLGQARLARNGRAPRRTPREQS